MEDEGLGGLLRTFDVEEKKAGQWGRPEGFDGLVLESPRGVPILVARKSFNDKLLPKISKGKDLWFQVHDGRGSRVLLRTSMVPNLAKPPRECMEMAADCAAFFADGHVGAPVWKRSDEQKRVMFTDTKHVNKRGSRVGQMKPSRSLVTIWARPERVAELARDAQEDQG